MFMINLLLTPTCLQVERVVQKVVAIREAQRIKELEGTTFVYVFPFSFILSLLAFVF